MGRLGGPLAEPRRALDKGPPGRHKGGSTSPVTVLAGWMREPAEIRRAQNPGTDTKVGGQVVEEIASKLGRCFQVSGPWIIVVRLCAHGLDVDAIDTLGVGSHQPCPGFPIESSPVTVKVLWAWWAWLVRHDRVRALTNRVRPDDGVLERRDADRPRGASRATCPGRALRRWPGPR